MSNTTYQTSDRISSPIIHQLEIPQVETLTPTHEQPNIFEEAPVFIFGVLPSSALLISILLCLLYSKWLSKP